MVSGIVVIGSGVAIVLYQQYVLTQSHKQLVQEVQKLNKNVSKLEKELKKPLLARSVSSDEIDDIFLDASESEPPTLKSDIERISPEGGVNGGSALETVLAQLDAQMDEAGPENLRAANETLKGLTSTEPANAEVYWRLAKSFFLLASEDLLINPSNDGSDDQKDLMKKAFEAAEMAVDADKECGEAFKWLAVIRGSITQYLPIQEQIKSAYDIKEDIMTSIRLNPKDSLSYHMLGRWCFSVYSLSWFERRIASTLFASPPTATLEEAMEAFMKAEELSPKESIDNCLYLAKCCLCKKDYNQMVSWLREGLKINGSSRDVRICSYTVRCIIM
ncbi:regulator of microtubule dynamics protein [Elysia marginata]|uniref:Regulator of microtubule dynamics protein 1 n=1 Tax=Elysia marginata TaxID=1093978 RepID=A0AAV4IWT9_9GAST|nr:regulator of microtubule dynamics protein [Elysia marginata]